MKRSSSFPSLISWQGLCIWASPPSLKPKSHWLRAMENALRVAVAVKDNISPKDLRTNIRPWLRLQCTTATEGAAPSCLDDASNQHTNASSNVILSWRISRIMVIRIRITTTVSLIPLLPSTTRSVSEQSWDPMDQRTPEFAMTVWTRLEQELSTATGILRDCSQRMPREIRLRSHEKEGRCHGSTKSTPSKEKPAEGQAAAGKAPAHDDVIKWKHFPRYWSVSEQTVE